jgi:enoyl-[acyl-carrier-protein] reductase (NADH)
MTVLSLTVLGSGSVGLAVAASYAQAGQSVTLLARGAAVPLLRQSGITVSGVCGDHQYEQSTPLGRACSVDDVAEAVLWLLEGARTVTGELILLDSGMHLGRSPTIVGRS